jgi:hypothetical protein
MCEEPELGGSETVSLSVSRVLDAFLLNEARKVSWEQATKLSYSTPDDPLEGSHVTRMINRAIPSLHATPAERACLRLCFLCISIGIVVLLDPLLFPDLMRGILS